MQLTEQQGPETKLQPAKQPPQSSAFLEPFKTFQQSITLALYINVARFLMVSAIYYWSDTTLSCPQPTQSNPWNSLIYFLAMMVEVIKFIGDCSLRNLLSSQQQRLKEIYRVRSQHPQSILANNVTLKGAKYEEYLSVYSLVTVFKYKHKSYASAFTISKCMHVGCTFLVFGWMALREQFDKDMAWWQLLMLGGFLVSVYVTSVEIDLTMLENSQGPFKPENGQFACQKAISQRQMHGIRDNFINWRKQFTLVNFGGCLILLASLFVNHQLSLLNSAILLVILINICNFLLQKKLQTQLPASISKMKRSQINTYSLLHQSTIEFRTQFMSLSIAQRLVIVILWIAFARDASLSLTWFFVVGTGIIMLLLGQIVKFKKGNTLKLMTLIQTKYQHDTVSSTQTQTHQNKEYQCAICLKVFEIGEKVKLLPCSKQHIYHSQCFQDWRKIKKQCPLCRYQLSDYI